MSRISKYLSEKDKDVIGRECCNCGQTTNLEYHHIVPLSFGGNDILTNYCCLCYGCHSLIHFGKRKNINHSEATKKGIEKARLNGKQIGAVKGKKLVTKKSFIVKDLIKKYNKDFEGQLTNEQTWKKIGVCKTTYYKYKKELKSA